MPLNPNREILKVLVGILREEMGLAADQVVIYNQRWKIPPDDRLYISVGLTGSRPYAVNRNYRSSYGVGTATEVDPVFEEEISINVQDVITLNVYSQSEAARLRRNEVVLALASTFAEQEMERLSFSIGAVPVSYVDVSEGEGTTMINRYAITFNVLYAQSSSKPVSFIDKVVFGKSTPVLQP